MDGHTFRIVNTKTEITAIYHRSSKKVTRLVPNSLTAKEDSRHGTPIPANVIYPTDDDENCLKLKMSTPELNVPTHHSVRVQTVTKLPQMKQFYNCLKQ